MNTLQLYNNMDDSQKLNSELRSKMQKDTHIPFS